MDRRRLLQIVIASIPSLPSMWSWLLSPRRSAAATRSLSRVRPADPEWPSEASWDRLSKEIRGNLVKVHSPLAECMEAPSSPSCAQIFKELKNPYYLGDEVGLTQSLGWVDAWTSRPSVYAVAAETTDDVWRPSILPARTISDSSRRAAAIVTRAHPMPRILC
jgi:hypothetical protein